MRHPAWLTPGVNPIWWEFMSHQVGRLLSPILLVMGTGELQFGHRYSSDLSVYLVVLTALGIGGRPGPAAIALLAVSIAMNAYGTGWFVSRYAG